MQYDIIAEKTFDHYQSVSLKDRIYLKARYKLCPYFKILDNLIPDSGTIVDWGCGFGFFSLYMKISQFKRQITGVEIDKRKIKVITKVTKEYSDFSIKHIDEVDIEHNTVDVVLLMEVSYYLTIQSYSKLLEFFNKILKDNGLLVVLNTYKKKNNWKYYFTMIQEFISTQIIKQTKSEGIFLRTEEEERELFSANKFKIIKSEKINSHLPYLQMVYVLQK